MLSGELIWFVGGHRGPTHKTILWTVIPTLPSRVDLPDGPGSTVDPNEGTDPSPTVNESGSRSSLRARQGRRGGVGLRPLDTRTPSRPPSGD